MAKKRVLVIEDDPSVRALVVGMLSQTYTVEQAPDGRAALSLLQTGSTYHAIVCDVMMPNLNGLDFARTIRATGHAPPIVFLTAKSAPLEVVEGINAGARFYIAKPFKMDELLDKVSRAVR